MRIILYTFFTLTILFAPQLEVKAQTNSTAKTATSTPKKKGKKPIMWNVLMYLPNRVFDVLDVARARAKIGPGLSVSARATKVANVSVGSHMTVFGGVPGPRNKAVPNLPVGMDNFTGLEASVINLSNNNNSPFSPSYGTGELGAGFQAFFIGLDLGVDPLEAGDLLLGFFMVDLKGDDM